MTEFRVRVDDEDDLRDLHRWLSSDVDARAGGVPKLIEPPPRTGQMGPGAEAIGLVINGVAAMGGVLSAIAAWRMLRTRPAAKSPTVTITTPGGTSVTVADGSPDEVAAIYRAIED